MLNGVLGLFFVPFFEKNLKKVLHLRLNVVNYKCKEEQGKDVNKMADKKELMKEAWNIAREGQKTFGGKVSEYFSEALKMAWAQAKNTIDVESLEAKGFSRWSKGNMDRLYFNIQRSGHMEVDHYNTGNISFAAIDGEEISHRFAGQILSVKCFIDLKHENKLVIQYGGPEAREIVKNVVEKVLD